MKNDLTLGKLKNTDLYTDLVKSLFKKELSEEFKLLLLKAATILLNSNEDHLKELGYRLILLYTIKAKDYLPLFDTAINLGYFPIAKLIEDSVFEPNEKADSFFGLFQSSYIENFRNNTYISTFQQQEVRLRFKSEHLENESVAVVAPTSYGKSELIGTTVNLCESICILVPTKALLAQTKRRVLADLKMSNKTIITHPEMPVPADKSNIICIFTQERLIRFFQLHENLYFDRLFVDEAHNLLDDSDRSRLLAFSIMMARKRSGKTSVTYLTPFIVDATNLKTRTSDETTAELRISENLKSELFYLYDLRKTKELIYYDQYFGKFHKLKKLKSVSDVKFINRRASNKNIVYFNRPIHAQKFAKKLCADLPPIESPLLDKAISDIKDVVHKDYDLLYCLKRGVVYHHGSIPDNIKLFIEFLYTTIPEVKYLVTTSTLLEGVNIPAERLFVMDYRKGRRKLTSSQFKNLYGRICRFSEVFNSGKSGLQMLMPRIYLINSEYMPVKANLRKFYTDCLQVNLKKADKPENVLLDSVEITLENIDSYNDFGEFINNVEEGTLTDVDSRSTTTDFGKECFLNNIFEIDIFDNEKECQKEIDKLVKQGKLLSDPLEIIEGIATIFFKKIKEDDEDRYRSLLRLKGNSAYAIGARNFYSMLLNWRMENTSVHEMVWRFVQYWDELILTTEDAFIYVGKWGEEAREGYLPRWVNISEKTDVEKINLAIVRIKDEFDFLDNTLMKFIEVLNNANVIAPTIYSKIKYGTDDLNKIAIIKSGISLQLTNLITKRYVDSLVIDNKIEQVYLKDGIIEKFEKNNESELLKHEARFHIRK